SLYHDEEDKEDEVRPAEDPVARAAFGEVVPQPRSPQEYREGIHTEDLVRQESQRRPSDTMISGITHPILQRRPAIGSVPEQEWEDQDKGDQVAKSGPAGEQQTALRGQQQTGNQRESPEEDGLLRQQAQASH